MQVRTAVVLAVLSALGAGAEAVTLYSPTLKAYTGDPTKRRLQCSVVNVSSEAKLATIWIVYWNGVSGSPTQVTVPPGQMRLKWLSAAADSYCKVQVAGLKTDWRGTFEVQGSVNGVLETRVSVPLQ